MRKLLVLFVAVCLLGYSHLSFACSTPKGPAIVQDANGNQIGPWFINTATSANYALVAIGGTYFLLPYTDANGGYNIDTNGFIITGRAVYYSGANCTGTAYLPRNSDSPVIQIESNAAMINGVITYPNPTSTPGTQSIQSNNTGSGTTCVANVNNISNLVPVLTANVPTTFTTPFSVKVSGN